MLRKAQVYCLTGSTKDYVYGFAVPFGELQSPQSEALPATAFRHSTSAGMTLLTSPQPSVAIIGAGLGGLALALFLRRTGLATTISIFELRSRNAKDGGYLALAPNALHQLNQLDLYESLLPQGYAYEELTFLSGRGTGTSKIGAVLNGSRGKYGFPALRISRHIVRQTLLQAAEEDPLIRIEFKKKLIEVTECTDFNGVEEKVCLSFADKTSYTFDYVVGADGIHSKVRQAISNVEPAFSGQMGIGGGKLPRSLLPTDQPLPCLFMGRTNGFMMMPTVADSSVVSAFATIEADARSRDAWAKLDEDKVEIAGLMTEGHCGQESEWPQIVQQACTTMSGAGKRDDLTVWPFFNVPDLPKWTSTSSRIIIIGDSAHAMPPTGGQGAAMAFEDAASLARVFGKILDQDSGDFNTEFADELHKWQEQRKARCLKVKAFTSRSGDLRRSTPSMLQQISKEWLMWLFFLLKGKDGGFGWIYGHKERGPEPLTSEKLDWESF